MNDVTGSYAMATHDDNNPSPIGLYYNAEFTSDTLRKSGYILDECYKKALTKFQLIFASDELSVYKICHYFHKKYNLKERDFKTIDALAIESYFDAYANHKYNLMQLDKLVNGGVLTGLENRWLVIPNMTANWNARLAYMFYNALRELGAIGFIFHSDGALGLGKILIENSLTKVTQFPEQLYSPKNQLVDNGY